MDKDMLKRAVEWYRRGGDFRKAALELFDEKTLKRNLDKRLKEIEEEKSRNREIELQEILEECRRVFPIGTLIKSHEGTDRLPNLVIGEPYIKKSKYHVPYSKYNPGDENKKTVFVDTLRLFNGKPLDDRWGRSSVALEICLEHMKANPEDKVCYTNHIINLDEYIKEELEKKNRRIPRIEGRIKDLRDDIEKYEIELKELREYEPRELTKERIQEILKEYAEK